MHKVNFETLLEEVDKFSDYKLLEKQDLQIIIDCSRKKGIDQFDEIIFIAKYINGLFRVMQKIPGIQEVKDPGLIQHDLSENIDKIKSKIREVIAVGEESIRKKFEEKYFEMNQESFLNLRVLFSDLEWVKLYINAYKRGEI